MKKSVFLVFVSFVFAPVPVVYAPLPGCPPNDYDCLGCIPDGYNNCLGYHKDTMEKAKFTIASLRQSVKYSCGMHIIVTNDQLWSAATAVKSLIGLAACIHAPGIGCIIMKPVDLYINKTRRDLADIFGFFCNERGARGVLAARVDPPDPTYKMIAPIIIEPLSALNYETPPII